MDDIKVKEALSGVDIALFPIGTATPQQYGQVNRIYNPIATMGAVRSARSAVDSLDIGAANLPADLTENIIEFGPAASKIFAHATHSEAAGTCEITPVLFADSAGMGVPIGVLSPQTSTSLGIAEGSAYHSAFLSWDIPAGVGVAFLITALSTSNIVTVYGGVDDSTGLLNFGDVFTGEIASLSDSVLGFSYLDSEGAYHGWGLNADSETNPGEPSTPWTDTNIILAGPYVKVSRGLFHTLLLDASGNVYGFGWNQYGQANPADLTSPWIDEANVIATGCIDIAAGGGHSMALKSNGDVIGWGRNTLRQANPASATTPWVDPTNVIISGCKAIFAGDRVGFGIKTNGDVIGWGYNASKQIDPSETSPWIDTTNVITGSVQSVGIGANHTLFLKENGDVVGLGNNPACDKDSTDGAENIDVTRVLFSGVSAVACGSLFSAILKNGGVICYGSNVLKQCRPDSATDPWLDTSSPVISGISRIECGENTIFAVDVFGRYYAWGENDYQKANPGTTDSPLTSLETILTI